MFTLKVRKLFRKTLEKWAAAAPPTKPRRMFIPRLERLEDRELLNADVLIWNPVGGDGTNLASHAANWWDDTQSVQGVEAPGSGANGGQQVFLNTAYSNAPIIWDSSVNISQLLLTGGGGAQGGGGYTGQETINSGVTVTVGNTGIQMSGNIASLNVQFTDSTSKLVMTGGNVIWTNFQFTTAGGSVGEVDVAGGSIYAGGSGNYTETTQVPIRLLTGGSMTLQPGPAGSTPVFLKSGGGEMWVDNGGTLTLDDNDYNAVVFIAGDGGGDIGQNHERVFVAPQGTINFNAGVQPDDVGDKDALKVPVENQGTFNLFGSTPGATAQNASELIVYGSDSYTSNVSFDMQGVNSTYLASTNLFGGVDLAADQGYRGTSAVGCSSYLEDYDSNPEYVQAGGAGIYIGQSSYILFRHYNSTFGSLTLFGSVTMNGVLYVNIDGTQSNASDVLNVQGTMAWNPGSSISVAIWNFQLDSGLTWQIIKTSERLSGMGNVTVTPNTLTLDATQWAGDVGQLDS